MKQRRDDFKKSYMDDYNGVMPESERLWRIENGLSWIISRMLPRQLTQEQLSSELEMIFCGKVNYENRGDDGAPKTFSVTKVSDR
jgi:hypothetical protein